MKSLSIRILALGLVLVITSFSRTYSVGNDKIIQKARTSVEQAAPDDWETLAKAAHMCIRKNVNMTEAKVWFETSLQIKESAYGLEVAGDYYMANKLYDKAINHYVKSMLKVKENNFYEDTSALQDKINKAKIKA